MNATALVSVALMLLSLAPAASAQATSPSVAERRAAYSRQYREATAAGDAAGAARVLRAAIGDPVTDPAHMPVMCAALAVAERQITTGAPSAPPPPACSSAGAPPAAAPAPSPARAAAASPPASHATTPDPTRPPVVVLLATRPSRSWAPSAGPIALAAGGAASLALAGVLVALRDGALAPCSMQGNRALCPDAATLDRARDSVALTAGANAALAVGATAVLAATAWWLIDGRAVVPTVSATGAQIALVGRW